MAVCYDWPIEGDPNDKTAPVKTVELYFVYFEDTQNLYSIYTNEAVYTWNGEYWDNNMTRPPEIVLSYIKADTPDRYKVNGAIIQQAKGKQDVRYFRIKTPEGEYTYQYELGMTLGEWINSKYNIDGWKTSPDDVYCISNADGKYKINKDRYIWRVMRPE